MAIAMIVVIGAILNLEKRGWKMPRKSHSRSHLSPVVAEGRDLGGRCEQLRDRVGSHADMDAVSDG